MLHPTRASETLNRDRMYIHGGSLETHSGAPWYTHGCIKVADKDWAQLSQYIRGNVNATIPVTVHYSIAQVMGGIHK
jgi:hypothetical protein